MIPVDDDRPILEVALGAAAAAFAAEIVGNPVPVVIARPTDAAAGGGGTSVGVVLAGSSKVGTGKTGFEAALPVPDGPPPPTRLRGATPPAADALKACCTICCCRAKTSRPLVTYPA